MEKKVVVNTVVELFLEMCALEVNTFISNIRNKMIFSADGWRKKSYLNLARLPSLRLVLVLTLRLSHDFLWSLLLVTWANVANLSESTQVIHKFHQISTHYR